MTQMHHQYLVTRDMKFPDQRQYAKPGDLILFNDANATLTIYRNNALIGTVHFSKSGLQEFVRLGWIVRPVEVNAKPETKLLVGVDVGFKGKTGSVVVRVDETNATLTIEGDDLDITVGGDLSITADERTIHTDLPLEKPKRKPKKS